MDTRHSPAELPQWEAAYDSATFTPHLIARCNDEASAKNEAEAWLRAHCTDATWLKWTPDPVMTDDEWDQWWSLAQLDAYGTAQGTEIVVRHRAARA